MSLPNWIHSRYLALADQYKGESFGFEEAVQVLQKRFGDKEDQVKLVMSELRKDHFIEVVRSEEDSRKKVYTLTSVSDQKEKGKLTRGDIDRVLKKAADLIRTRVDYSFILLLLFYKRFSDQWNVEYRKAYQEAIKDKFSDKEADTEARKSAYHKINIPEEYSWDAIRKDTLKISENFSQAIKSLADLNPALKETFQQFDFSDFTRNPENNEILRQLVELFSSYSFENVSPDILGDAYEWILRYFAPQKAKEGEVYTPREVIQLMVELLDPQEGESVYDPAAGSSGMLIAAYKYVEENHSKTKADSLYLYGQEQNLKTLSLGKMNLLIHGITNGLMAQGDTIRFPKFKDGQSIKRFSYVLANPPWNQDGYDEEVLKTGDLWKDRFPFGFTPNQSADWAWVQHMYSSLKDKGKLAVILDTGALSRGSGSNNDKEKLIRRQFIEKDLIDAIILLPDNLFYNTSAPGIILIINKNKSSERAGKILLINATDKFSKLKPKSVLGPEHIKEIISAYKNYKDVPDFSKIVLFEQIKEADFNPSPSKFITINRFGNLRDVDELIGEIDVNSRQLIEAELQFKNSYLEIDSLGVLKHKWEEKQIEDLALVTDFVANGSFATIKSNVKYKQEEDFAILIRTQDYSNGFRGPFVYIDKEAYEFLHKTKLEQGDLILSNVGAIGTVFKVPNLKKPMSLGPNAILVKSKDYDDYLYYWFKSREGKTALQTITNKTTQPKFNKTDFRQLKVPVPPLREKEKIVSLLDQLETKIRIEHAKESLSGDLFESIMNKIVTKS